MFKLIVLMLLTTSLYGQTPAPKTPRQPETRQERRERMRTQMREQMRDSRRIINQFLNDDMFTDMHKQFEDMVKQFEDGRTDQFDQFFDDKAIERLFGGLRGSKAFGMLGSGQSRWIETPREKILVLKLEASKDTPIDFKIENSSITISGNIEKQTSMGVSKRSFKKSFNIPPDCDPTGAKFENKEGEILIKFPKLVAKDGRLPVKPDSGDSTI